MTAMCFPYWVDAIATDGDGGRQFVQDPQNKPIDQVTKNLIDKLLLERLSLAGIARVTEFSELRLQRYVNAKYAAVPRRVSVRAKKRGN